MQKEKLPPMLSALFDACGMHGINEFYDCLRLLFALVPSLTIEPFMSIATGVVIESEF
jgi:hypothetical protein